MFSYYFSHLESKNHEKKKVCLTFTDTWGTEWSHVSTQVWPRSSPVWCSKIWLPKCRDMASFRCCGDCSERTQVSPRAQVYCEDVTGVPALLLCQGYSWQCGWEPGCTTRPAARYRFPTFSRVKAGDASLEAKMIKASTPLQWLYREELKVGVCFHNSSWGCLWSSCKEKGFPKERTFISRLSVWITFRYHLHV